MDTIVSFFFFNDPATTEIYTLSLHDALPICGRAEPGGPRAWAVGQRRAAGSRRTGRWSRRGQGRRRAGRRHRSRGYRSEEHTSELQSRQYLVCRLLLEKKNNNNTYPTLVFTS